MDIFKTLETAEQAPDNPFPVFQSWLKEAETAEPNDPSAMALALVGADGRPSVRMVLLKHFDESGFVFYTNRDSDKGQALDAHPHAALCFHWKSLRRQVRIVGPVTWVDEVESDAYYNSRPRGSRLGAWASDQSRPLDNRSTLVRRVAALEKQYGEDTPIPRPPHWGGYRVQPDRIEFWDDGTDRLHTRVVYIRDGDHWTRQMLYP